ncbi:MAG: response regulator [Candidatus Omnitrophica bacterium]|nr:response regulator [Candidatus Omnitrophota bacterium]
MSLILVIEDNDMVRDMLVEMLNRLEYEVVSASDGEDGLRKAIDLSPDIVLLDITLPKLDGYDICRILKSDEKTRRIPVLMITGISEKKQKLKGIELGADGFLTKPVDMQELLVRIRSLIKMKKLNEELENVDNILSALVSIIDAKDAYTHNHSSRVKEISFLIAVKLSFTKEQLSILNKAAELHDIGKIGVSEVILNKVEKLTEEEFDSIRKHSCIGEELCKPLKSLNPILKIIRHHHERYDGKGYPDGIKGEEIPIEARVIAVVDSYDAMATDRPYRGKLSMEKILSELNQGKGTQWDEKVVNCFLDLLKSGKIEDKS